MRENPERICRLTEYVHGLMLREDGKELYQRYKQELEQVTPQEAFGVFHHLLEDGAAPKDILVFLDKVINVFYKSLSAYQWKHPEENSFLDYLTRENQALTKKLDEIKELLRQKDYQANKKELLSRVTELNEFNPHYLKKENILFPYLERKLEKFNGLAIMWSLHDEARAQLKRVIECLKSDGCAESEFNAQIGSLFFAMQGLVQKEELILFPAASEVIDEHEWLEMQKQSLEYEFPFIEGPKQETAVQPGPRNDNTPAACFDEELKFKTETGELDFEQLMLVFGALPVDLTFVDENDKVKYFTKPKDRIFPRSAAVIGRNVDKCHPPESVHVVHDIINSFRSGKQDTARFWINLKGKTILIQYFALRNAKGKYKGVLEVSQDMTEIKELQGERRLLHWKE